METTCELTLETGFDCILLFSVEFFPANKVDTEQGKVLTQCFFIFVCELEKIDAN